MSTNLIFLFNAVDSAELYGESTLSVFQPLKVVYWIM